MKKDAKWSLHRFFLIFNYAYPFKRQPHIMVKHSHAIHFIQFIWVCLTILWGWRLKGEHPNKVFEYRHIHTSRTLKRKKSLSKSLHDVTQFHICYHCPIVANNVILLTRNNTLNNFLYKCREKFPKCKLKNACLGRSTTPWEQVLSKYSNY